MADGVNVLFDSTTYGRYFQAIPIAKATLLSYATTTTYIASEDVILYKVTTGDVLNGDVGVFVNGTLVTGIDNIPLYLAKGESVDLVGNFIEIK